MQQVSVTDSEVDAGPDSSGRAHVLIVEDNQINREILEMQVGQLGYGVRSADNGEEALRVLREQACDVILTDIQMPVMDGLMLARKVRETDGGRYAEVPIIAISAYISSTKRAQYTDAGMNDFLVKPVKRGQLSHMLDRWCPRHEDVPVWRSEAPGVDSRAASTDVFNPQNLLEDFHSDVSVVERLLRKFCETSQGILDSMRHHVQHQESADAVRDEAHKLATSAGVVGACTMARLARTIETLPPDCGWQTITDMVQQLDAAWGFARVAIEQWLQNRTR